MHSSQLMLCYQVTCLKTLITNTSKLSHTHQVILKALKNFYYRNRVLATNSISNSQRTSPKVLAPNQGCSTARPSRTDLRLFWHFFLSLFRDLFSRPPPCYQANSSQDCPWKSHHLLTLSKSICNSKWSSATSCASPMLMHFSRLPHNYRVLSYRSSHQEQSSMSVTKQAGHERLPYKPNDFCTSYQQ